MPGRRCAAPGAISAREPRPAAAARCLPAMRGGWLRPFAPALARTPPPPEKLGYCAAAPQHGEVSRVGALVVQRVTARETEAARRCAPGGTRTGRGAM